MTVNFEHTGV